jgi:hypothetical protein
MPSALLTPPTRKPARDLVLLAGTDALASLPVSPESYAGTLPAFPGGLAPWEVQAAKGRDEEEGADADEDDLDGDDDEEDDEEGDDLDEEEGGDDDEEFEEDDDEFLEGDDDDDDLDEDFDEEDEEEDEEL